MQVLPPVLQLFVVHWLAALHHSPALLRLQVLLTQSMFWQSPAAAQAPPGGDTLQVLAPLLQLCVVQCVPVEHHSPALLKPHAVPPLAVQSAFWQSPLVAQGPPGLDLLQSPPPTGQLPVVHWLDAEQSSPALLRLQVPPPQSLLRQSLAAAHGPSGYESAHVPPLQDAVVQSVLP